MFCHISMINIHSYFRTIADALLYYVYSRQFENCFINSAATSRARALIAIFIALISLSISSIN